MKKLAFMFVAMMALSFVACENKPAAPAEPEVEATDTTATDTTAADTVAADSVVADSAAAE